MLIRSVLKHVMYSWVVHFLNYFISISERDVEPEKAEGRGDRSSGLLLRIFRHSYCGQVLQKSHSSTPKFTHPHLEHTKYVKASKVKP